MDFTALLDIAIGLALVYLTASLFVTIINEYLGQALQRRGKQLRDDLNRLISDPNVREKLKQTQALAPFFSDDKKVALPSYTDPTVLARLLIGAVGNGASSMSLIRKEISDAPIDAALKAQLLWVASTVKDDVEALVQGVGQWADQSLTMMGEAYKRHTQVISLVIGFLVAITFNLDTIGLAAHLYRDGDSRAATSAAALQFVSATQPDRFNACLGMPPAVRAADVTCAGVTSLVEGLRLRDASLGVLPIGWPRRDDADVFANRRVFASAVGGWALTALAISLGAAFWFDLLNRLVNVRHGMRKPGSEAGA